MKRKEKRSQRFIAKYIEAGEFSKGRGVVKKEMKLKGVLPWMLVK